MQLAGGFERAKARKGNFIADIKFDIFFFLIAISYLVHQSLTAVFRDKEGEDYR